jgi:hypothetical protein
VFYQNSAGTGGPWHASALHGGSRPDVGRLGRTHLDPRDEATRRRLLERLNELVGELVRDPPAPSRWKAAGRCLNSPIVLTIAGGVLVSVLTMQWQARLDARERARVARDELRDRRQELIASFATSIVASMEYVRAYRDRECWIVEKALEPDARYDDGRLTEETRRVVEELRREYAARPTADALCARIRGLFAGCATIRAEADRLDAILDRFMRVETRAELARRYGDADRSFQELITLMELETTREAALEIK